MTSAASAATPLARDGFASFTPPMPTMLGGESLSGLGGAETFDPIARAQLLARDMPLNWSGAYQPFGQSQPVAVALRLASATPMGQMIDLRGEITVAGVTSPVQGNLNAESDQLDLLLLCDCDVASLEMGGAFTGLQGLQLSGWQSPRLTHAGGRLELHPLKQGGTSGSASTTGSTVRGLW